MNYKEQIYKSDKDVKYIFVKGNPSLKKLIVIFSGYAAFNAKLKHRYNYIKALDDINVNKLYILDDNGKTGSYYLGEHLNFNVDSSVLSLIMYISRLHNINNKDIITLGSSKGGTAALYFGLKYKFGAVFSGAFQTKISDLITKRRPESTEFLLGNTEDPNYKKRYNQLNSIMFNLLKSPVLSNLYLISSKNDWQYNIHVKPFIEELQNQNISFDFELSTEMQNHSEISIYFPRYFAKNIVKELFSVHFDSIDFTFNEHTYYYNHSFKNYSNNIFKVSVQAYSNGENFVILPETVYEVINPSPYLFYLQIENLNGEILYKHLINEHNFYKQEQNKYDIKIENNQLHFYIYSNNSDSCSYAFYIRENGKVIEKIMYQEKNYIIRDVNINQEYSVQYYIMSKDGNKIVGNSKIIKS